MMTGIEAMIKKANTKTHAAVKSGLFGDNVISHPARASMGQKLAGTGALVFEGELLELPLSWHPARTRH